MRSTFHQFEFLAVGHTITMADLKGTLNMLAEGVFGEGTRIRLRPSYFPFTEPSAELDVSCNICSGSGCRICKHTGWLELGGCGMVHPEGVAQRRLRSGRFSAASLVALATSAAR